MPEDNLSYRQKLALIRQGLHPKTTGPKAKKPIPKQSEKKKAEMKEQKAAGGDSSLDAWFEERRKEMTGKCCLCGGKTCKSDDETYRRSIHHLFDKRPTMFPSVSTNPDNWLEVCFWGNSCHTNIHNGTITMELLHDSAEWPMIVEKFKKVYPFIAESERKNIHNLLLKEIVKH
jgi:hypothetical protein